MSPDVTIDTVKNKIKAPPESKSISWRMKLPRDLHAKIKAIAESQRREINAQCIYLIEVGLACIDQSCDGAVKQQ